jgi:hypothetical protein
MKSLGLLVLVVGSMFLSTGCMTPAYTGAERGALIARNIAYDYTTMNDDIDDILLLRPATRLSMWHVR